MYKHHAIIGLISILTPLGALNGQTTHEDSIELRNTGFSLILGSRTIDLAKSHIVIPNLPNGFTAQYVQHGHFEETSPRQVILFTDLCRRGHLFCKHGAGVPSLAESELFAGASQKRIRIEVYLERKTAFSWAPVDASRPQVLIESRVVKGVECCAHLGTHDNWAWVIFSSKLLNGATPERMKRQQAKNASVRYVHSKINNRDVRIGRIKLVEMKDVNDVDSVDKTRFDRQGLKGCTFLEICSKEEGCGLVQNPPTCGASPKDWVPAADGKPLNDCVVEEKQRFPSIGPAASAAAVARPAEHKH